LAELSLVGSSREVKDDDRQQYEIICNYCSYNLQNIVHVKGNENLSYLDPFNRNNFVNGFCSRFNEDNSGLSDTEIQHGKRSEYIGTYM